MIREIPHKHRFRTEILMDGLPQIIVADKRKLKQIIFNLLSNAAKFISDNGVIILTAAVIARSDQILQTTSGKRLALPLSDLDANHPSNKYVQISVKDTGIGLAPNDLDRIFDSFEQVESSKSRKYQGTGMGLTLAKNFVSLHGGVIWAESQGEGQGSSFSFILPVVVPEGRW